MGVSRDIGGAEMCRTRMGVVADRSKFIVERAREVMARGGGVAHLGCTDSPYTSARLASDELLHGRLLRAGPAVGFDVDLDALGLLAGEYADAEFVGTDISSVVPAEHRQRYDLVIAGEVLEHVPDARRFLLGCGVLLCSGGHLLVSVPNACSPKIGARALMGREAVHPDHFVYYGPRTLTRALTDAGFEIAYLASYFASPGSIGRFVNVGLRMAHRLTGGPVGEGLIALAVRSRPH